MNCRGVSRRLSAYIDNGLSPGINQSVEEHLKGCPSCRRRLAELKGIIEVTRKLPPLKVSEGFAERVLKTVHARQNTKEVANVIRIRFVLGAAAFATAAIVVFFLVGPQSSPVTNSFTGSVPESSAGLAVNPDSIIDEHMKMDRFPVPEGLESRLTLGDSLLFQDTSSKIDQFILPVVEPRMVHDKF